MSAGLATAFLLGACADGLFGPRTTVSLEFAEASSMLVGEPGHPTTQGFCSADLVLTVSGRGSIEPVGMQLYQPDSPGRMVFEPVHLARTFGQPPIPAGRTVRGNVMMARYWSTPPGLVAELRWRDDRGREHESSAATTCPPP